MGWDVSVEDAGNLGSWMTSAAVTGGDALNSVSVAAQRVDELGLDFEGQTADAVKNYWTQVHGCMLSAIGAALTQLTASYAEYYNELAEIDGDAYARFKTSSDDSHLPSGYEQVDAPVDCVNLPKDTWNVDTAFERGNIIDTELWPDAFKT